MSEDDLEVIKTVFKIHEAAWECDIKNSNESDWNTQVHGALLNLVADNKKYGGSVACRDM